MALVGQNGCGKSTFIKVLSGYHDPDDGSLAQFDGEERDASATRACRVGSASTSSTRTSACSTTSRRPRTWRSVPGSRPRRRASSGGASSAAERPTHSTHSATRSTSRHRSSVSARHSGSASPSHERWSATPITRSRLLVLDEPTAAMPQSEVDNLFAVVRRLRDAGTSTLFVSHRLDEVFAIADRVTVVRDGRTVTVCATTDLDHHSLIESILGRPGDPTHDGASSVRSSSSRRVVGPWAPRPPSPRSRPRSPHRRGAGGHRADGFRPGGARRPAVRRRPTSRRDRSRWTGRRSAG